MYRGIIVNDNTQYTLLRRLQILAYKKGKQTPLLTYLISLQKNKQFQIQFRFRSEKYGGTTEQDRGDASHRRRQAQGGRQAQEGSGAPQGGGASRWREEGRLHGEDQGQGHRSRRRFQIRRPWPRRRSRRKEEGQERQEGQEGQEEEEGRPRFQQQRQRLDHHLYPLVLE